MLDFFTLTIPSVTNLVASHHTTAAHHPWTTTPIIHCTTTHTFPSTIAPITQLSPITNQPWLSCHTCTSFTHPHRSSTHPYIRCKVLFCPGWHSERFPCILLPCVYLDCLYYSDPLLPAFLTLPAFKVQGSLSFVTYTIIQGIISSEMLVRTGPLNGKCKKKKIIIIIK